ncbi:MAG: CHASE2 domain-containing protein [Cyanomargarita calcarea GSE-NOS-MK-12-04C]|jgi:diguanylate cyclase (GGDEF)-like protein/PAS domain S-box-containing protein|uniref:CHASE2 domain-containing protein n=1 Tax=Cyanomargarita calcarea GSE-NOS-MK-12-04C TaxID=2839659 RepID=A0A951QMH9_9CYAN|nr:CHASE2 domain-containing protein [Cyanomargarita calcarea GSE-NOS-MK-12-04C]
MVMSKLSLLTLKRPFGQVNRELITAFSVAVCVLLLRSIGLLQSLEWAALDQFFQLRPFESQEERITIVAIDEVLLRQVGSWPIPDEEIAKLLQKIQAQKPRAIGLDIYRDLPVGSGNEELVYAYKSMPNLIGIELLGQSPETHVLPPPQLSADNRVGFNNVLFDADGKVRRSLLYSQVNGKQHESFALKLAKLYLKANGIVPKPAASNRDSLQLGKTVFRRFQSNHGAYVGADAKGYQIISNFPKPTCKGYSVDSCHFLKVSMRDVLSGKVKENLIRDRIVLVGSTAPSLQDFFLMPYSSRLVGTVKPVAGIELQAYFISELISAALEGRPLIKVWSDPVEWVWIFAWAYLGSAMRWRTRNFWGCIFSVLLSYFLLAGSAYFIFLYGWWIPLMPALLTFTGSAVVITFEIAHMQEELKRSKDFLHQVINTIPDPIFVKNEKLQWIVLNQAYCQLIGYSKDVLLDKSDYNFFPKHEADVFRTLDKLVLRTQEALEHEKEFTSANGKTYFIATKRSLHKDAAGNFFLVGVIRDITERKLMELKLKRIAAELFHSNNELKLKEDHFRYLAYHDPLTGLTNRKYFIEQLSESIAWAQSNNLLLALLFIDLDGFKQVNDTLGHEIGDRLLVTIAQRLSNCLRGSDTVSRLGGDEFTVILRAIPKLDVAVRVAEKILTTIAEPIVLDEHTTKVSASIGISIYPLNSQDCETLIRQADAAMYRAKHLGKNRTYFA